MNSNIYDKVNNRLIQLWSYLSMITFALHPDSCKYSSMYFEEEVLQKILEFLKVVPRVNLNPTSSIPTMTIYYRPTNFEDFLENSKSELRNILFTMTRTFLAHSLMFD